MDLLNLDKGNEIEPFHNYYCCSYRMNLFTFSLSLSICAFNKTKSIYRFNKMSRDNKKTIQWRTKNETNNTIIQTLIRLKCIWQLNGPRRRNNPIKICWVWCDFPCNCQTLNRIENLGWIKMHIMRHMCAERKCACQNVYFQPELTLKV